ncbi:Ankyrin repeat-containing domain, partial [Paramuricea clavata]
AVLSGSLEIVKYLVEHGADVNLYASRSDSPLHTAASSGSLEIVKYLVEHGANVNLNSSIVGTALHSAASSASLEIVKYLVEHGANVNLNSLIVGTAIHSAASFASLKIVKYLVEHNADVTFENYRVGSPLHSAASSGSLEIVKYLVEHNGDVNCEIEHVGSPLHSAASSGSLEILKYLVEHGANVNLNTSFVASSGSLEIVKYLFEHNADVNCENGRVGSPLHTAASSGSLEIIKYLVEHGANVNLNTSLVGSPLRSAASSGTLEIVKYLVEHGANVNLKTLVVGSPLHSAASSGSLEIVKYLVEHNADVNCENGRVGSPLHSATSSGSLEIVKYLVEHGADVIHNAAQFGSLEMVKYLVEHGAELTNEENLDMRAILFLACEDGNPTIVDYLLQHGAIKDMNNWKLQSPLRIACRKGHTTVVQILLKYNVDIQKEKEPLICGNDEIINILNVDLKKSLKHREKIQILKGIDNVNLTKVGPPVKYFSPQKSLKLGKGSMGVVYVGILEDGAEVAVKRILKQEFEDTAKNELEILSRIDASKSPFIVSYRKCLEDATFVYIVLDLYEETLTEHVRTQRLEYLQDRGPRMIKDILSGIEFLHSRKILHRDLKPSNVLVDLEGHMRLADFGISRVLNEEETTVHTGAKGTRDWMPAEVIEAIYQEEKGRFKKKSDVQVAGMIAFYISTKGEHPFGPALERMINISKGSPVNLDMLRDLQVRKFISWLISHNINDRPYAADALADSFMVHVTNSLRKIILQKSRT